MQARILHVPVRVTEVFIIEGLEDLVVVDLRELVHPHIIEAEPTIILPLPLIIETILSIKVQILQLILIIVIPPLSYLPIDERLVLLLERLPL